MDAAESLFSHNDSMRVGCRNDNNKNGDAKSMRCANIRSKLDQIKSKHSSKTVSKYQFEISGNILCGDSCSIVEGLPVEFKCLDYEELCRINFTSTLRNNDQRKCTSAFYTHYSDLVVLTETVSNMYSQWDRVSKK